MHPPDDLKKLRLGDFAMPPKSAVLCPLYIYPLPGAWEPLYSAISAYPDLTFVVILNPHNGPGASEFPDAKYAMEIPRLNAWPNVITVGYVRIDYCKRDLVEVFRDVTKYSGWADGVQGIFLDETPNVYTASMATYLDGVDRFVKETVRIRGSRLVIHNPGTVPDPELANPGPDITTIAEESYENYQSSPLQERLSALLRYDRNRCAYMVHSVPHERMQSLVNELRYHGKYLFVTDLEKDYYTRFGSSWKRFIEAMQMD